MIKHIVTKGDTLSEICRKYYNDTGYMNELLDFNAIERGSVIKIGQVINVPKLNIIAVKSKIKIPHGFQEIVKEYGDIRKYITSTGELLPSWKEHFMTTIDIPIKLFLSWDSRLSTSRITCHKKAATNFIETFEEIRNSDMQKLITNYGGTFMFRQKRSGSSFSTHSWGIAIDINPLTNQMNTDGDIDIDLVNVFRKHGFEWGGDWGDPMHFQLCTGY
jgi:LysM repeat protein